MPSAIHILATPKKFAGKVAEIQKRAVMNWLHLGENVRVTVLSDDAGEFLPRDHPRLRVLRATDGMRSGTAPEFTEVLDLAGLAADDYVLYCNSDILFTSAFVSAAVDLARRNWLLCGHRVDLKETVVPPWLPGELDAWLQPAISRGDAKIHDHYGIDYFGTKRKTWKGFGKAFIGRNGIDGALLAHCLRTRYPIADCTGLFWAIHQWHDFSHNARGEVETRSGEHARHNLRHHKIRYGSPSLLDADFYFEDGVWSPGFRRRSKARTIERFLRFRLHISQVGIGFAAVRKLLKKF